MTTTTETSAHDIIAARLDGSTTRHANRAALDAARRRATGSSTIVDTWPANDPPPRSSDARAWDDYRARRGYAGGV